MTYSPNEVEAALAAIGADKILDASPKFGRKERIRARDLPKEMHEAFDRFFATSKFDPSEDLPPFDYDSVLALVSAGQTPEQARALQRAVPDPDLAMELGLEANRVAAWGNQSIPRNQRVSLSGAKVMDQPDAESLAAFRTRWQVACDPMVVVRDVLEGCLDADQVATVALLYPALYAEMRQACADALTAAATRHGAGWEPSPDKARQMQTLRQEDPTDMALAASVQQTYAQQAKPKPSRSKRRPARGPDNDDLTPGQRAASGQ